jgi:purine nucleosidase
MNLFERSARGALAAASVGAVLWASVGSAQSVSAKGVTAAGMSATGMSAATPAASSAQQLVMIDTDIGDDIDDVFAVGLALSSPELRILGMTSAWGDTALKSRLLDRLLCETGREDIPVATGISGEGTFTQRRWAERQPDKPHPEAVGFLLDQIKQHPGEITLIGIGPLTNIGAAIKRDPETFKKLKRVVIMGGSVRKGYGDVGYLPGHGPDAEYNLAMDVAAAKALFTAGVPLYVMPLDSTQIKLDDSRRQMLFSLSTPLTDAMTLLYEQWSVGHNLIEPTLYDDVAVEYAVDPGLCPVTPLRLVVDDKGFTREVEGPPNAFVCLQNDSDRFYRFFMKRLLEQRMSGSCEVERSPAKADRR